MGDEPALQKRLHARKTLDRSLSVSGKKESQDARRVHLACCGIGEAALSGGLWQGSANAARMEYQSVAGQRAVERGQIASE